ncbi:MAG: OadG family protein [Anaerolineales bacterium]|nr:OadG family protein [Anaerolineales bacterium]
MATTQGIYITVLGMAILFAALLILMLAAMALERLFRAREPAEVAVQLEERPSSEREKELAAAIAVAIALKLKPPTPDLQYPISNIQSQTAQRVLSGWKFLGRYRQLMRSRDVKGHRR